jgi:DNA modification methylase
MLQPNRIYVGHCLDLLQQLPDNSIHACITSPPYFNLRNYGLSPSSWPAVTFAPMVGLPTITIPEQECCLGLEKDLWSYVGHLVAIFRGVRRVLHPTGVLWCNLGDSYSGSNMTGGTKSLEIHQRVDRMFKKESVNTDLPPKNLMLIPHRVALALQADGWHLRSDCPWLKKSAMPESVTDRPSKATENIFLLSKSEHYFYDAEAIKKPQSKTTFDRFGNGTPRKKAIKLGGSSRQNESFNNPVGILPNGRNRRTTDWFYESLDSAIDHLTAIRDSGGLLLSEDNPEAFLINPQSYKGSHFATWPEKLVEPCLLSSTSQEGVCGKCGGQWVRVVEKVKDSLPVEERNGRWDGPTTKATGEWQPSCSCPPSSPVPALILDPFAGSGTTLQVAIKHRRQAIGFDLNSAYANELAVDRLDGTQINLF